MSKKDGGLPPEDVTQNQEQIIKDTQRVIRQYHDDSFGAMTRIALAPCSPFSVTPELMRQTARIARENNLQIHTHLAETKDEEAFCLNKFGQRPFEYMQSLGWISDNAWFAHSIYLNDAEIRQAGAAQIGVAHCPSSNMRLGSGIARIKELLETGVKVGIGVDGSASNDSSNMLLETRNAMLISRMLESQFWLSTEEILWMATVGGAKALGRDDIGRIEPGKCADLTLISMDRIEYAGAQHDPAAAIIFCAALSPVDWVIVNGRVVVEKGQVRGLDEPALISKQQQISNELVDRAQAATGKKIRR
jgi:8-oxoguanine deaminase